MSEWQQIGLELDRRVKRYSRAGGELNPGSGHEGVRLFEDLDRLMRNEERNHDSAKWSWEWIFEPLVHRLLEEIAVWVCIGHFTGDRANPVRRWSYFFSEELSWASENSIRPEQPYTALRALTFNAQYNRKAESSFISTSALLEALPPNMSSGGFQGGKIEYPYGSSLLVSLRGDKFWENNLSSSGKYLRDSVCLCDWRNLYSIAIKNQESRLDLLRKMISSRVIDEWVGKNLTSRDDKKVPLRWDTINDSLRINMEGYADEYRQELVSTFPTITPDAIDIESRLRFFVDKLGGREADIYEKISRYVGWVQDIAPSSMGGILTIPAWLPGEGLTGRSGSLVIAVKYGQKVSSNDICSIISAFRLGSVNIALDEKNVQGLRKATDIFGHEVKHMAIAISDHWMVRPESVLGDLSSDLGSDESGKINRYKIAPFPELFESAGQILRLWCQLDNPEDVFPEGTPESLSSLVDKCWILSKSVLKAYALKGAKFEIGTKLNISKIQYAEKIIDEIDNLWSDRFQIKSKEPKILWERRKNADWMNMARLIISVLTNVIRHADPSYTIRVTMYRGKYDRGGHGYITIRFFNHRNEDGRFSNKNGEKSDLLDKIYSAMESNRSMPFTSSRFSSESIIREMLDRLNAKGKVREFRNKYISEFTIPLKSLEVQNDE